MFSSLYCNTKYIQSNCYFSFKVNKLKIQKHNLHPLNHNATVMPSDVFSKIISNQKSYHTSNLVF